MIDNSISDQMKEIWIDLNLYFESYEFSKFQRFFWIFLNFFLSLNRLKQLKKGKKGVYFCVGPTWMRRGMQGHMAEPRGLTQVPAWRGCDTYIYLLVI